MAIGLPQKDTISVFRKNKKNSEKFTEIQGDLAETMDNIFCTIVYYFGRYFLIFSQIWFRFKSTCSAKTRRQITHRKNEKESKVAMTGGKLFHTLMTSECFFLHFVGDINIALALSNFVEM